MADSWIPVCLSLATDCRPRGESDPSLALTLLSSSVEPIPDAHVGPNYGLGRL